MWDLELEVGKTYNVNVDMIHSFHEGLCKNYKRFIFVIQKDDGKLHIYNENSKDFKGNFEIVRFVKEPFKWYNPFKKRKVLDVLIHCISKKEG